jgi:hypothetical protein
MTKPREKRIRVMFLRLTQHYFFFVLVLFSLLNLGSMAWASNIQIEVIYGQSNLNMVVNSSGATPGRIRGQITTDTATTVQVYVNSTDIFFGSGSESFRAILSGTIGGRPVSMAPVSLPISPGQPPLIDLSFDVPASQLSQGLVPAGFYPSTPVSIFALSSD